MIRLGYAAQAGNPPPGMVALLNEFLQSAQKLLFRKHPSLRTQRFYKWTMAPGVRYYGIADNEVESPACARRLDAYSVTWVGFEDLNEAWYPLIKGIDPVLYTRASTSTGWPERYEIRSCIEIWPAPQGVYSLWVKGHFGLEPFIADSDRTTLDDEAVFLLALGNAKSHYGKADAQTVLAQANTYLLDLKAGMHGTARYVPQGFPNDRPATPPRFLPLG